MLYTALLSTIRLIDTKMRLADTTTRLADTTKVRYLACYAIKYKGAGRQNNNEADRHNTTLLGW